MGVVEKQIKSEVNKQKERIDDGEVRLLLAEMVNKTAQDHMDDKFEHAFDEVAAQIDKYMGYSNEQQNKQYDDFNQHIKNAFGSSLKQI
mmetsp:Transcript_45408/g.33189  ORF Transcript_45408/g.33189 Transcript_45408/m.33189 type:complete len:89 (+) Transcript_45408:274-540(+)